MEAIVTGDEVEIRFGYVFRGGRNKPHPVIHTVVPGVSCCFGDRRLVEVVTEKSRIRIRLGHQNSRESDAAADVCDPTASPQLFYNAL